MLAISPALPRAHSQRVAVRSPVHGGSWMQRPVSGTRLIGVATCVVLGLQVGCVSSSTGATQASGLNSTSAQAEADRSSHSLDENSGGSASANPGENVSDVGDTNGPKVDPAGGHDQGSDGAVAADGHGVDGGSAGQPIAGHPNDGAPPDAGSGDEGQGSALAEGGKQPRKVLASRVFPDEGRNDACGHGKGVGQSLPSFDLPSTSGKNVSSRASRGQVTLVNFWATWCKPCLSELPKFNKLARRYRKNGLRFLAISTDDDGAAVQALLEEKSLSLQALYQGEAIAKQFGERPLPFTLVVDPRGKVIAVYDGFREECLGTLESDLRQALEARK